MMRRMLFTLAILLGWTGAAFAWHVEGRIYCQQNGLPLAGVVVNIVGSSASGPFTGLSTTDDNGAYYVALLEEPGTFTLTLDLTAIGGGTVVSGPALPLTFTTTASEYIFFDNWVVNSPSCEALGCWLTGGGAKYNAIANGYLAEKGPQVSFGGNVYPGCSPEAGQGGNWNHVDRTLKLHFQGRAIVVDRCGNVEGIPPGSTSPVTPFNFIEFHGTGTLKPIAGGKYAGPTDVCFAARAEDRNEPGSSGVRDGALKDRYFIRVFPCDAPATTLLILEDSALPGTTDPVAITDGNLQLHISSCP